MLISFNPKPALLLVLIILGIGAGAQTMMSGANQNAQAVQTTVAGTISAINGNTIFVTTGDNQVKTVTIDQKSLILGRSKATLASIQPGEALGVAAIRATDGSLSATAINIFTPELWQQVRKGQFPMANGQVMTNAPVEKVGAEMKNRVLYLKYQMLSAAITVPDAAEIHRMVGQKLGALKTGLKISARGTDKADGSLTAASINFDLAD